MSKLPTRADPRSMGARNVTPVRVNSGDAGSTCGALYPSGNLKDSVDGVDVTLIDNGMPVVILSL